MHPRNHPLRALVVAAATFGLSAAAHAGSATNLMNNIVTLADACDIAAIGIDFGIKSAASPTASAVVTTNTTTGNTATGNTSHPKAGLDSATSGDGTTGDNKLTLTTGIGAVDSLISTALSTVIGALPGVYVACTATPTSITLTSANSASTFTFPNAVGTAASTTPWPSKMPLIGGTAAQHVDYTVTFAGTPTAATITGGPTLFIGAFTASGSIPAVQTGTLGPGAYWDGATATVNF